VLGCRLKVTSISRGQREHGQVGDGNDSLAESLGGAQRHHRGFCGVVQPALHPVERGEPDAYVARHELVAVCCRKRSDLFSSCPRGAQVSHLGVHQGFQRLGKTLAIVGRCREFARLQQDRSCLRGVQMHVAPTQAGQRRGPCAGVAGLGRDADCFLA